MSFQCTTFPSLIRVKSLFFSLFLPVLVHNIFVIVQLVRANSPEEAYKSALELGKDSETSYENMDGKLITVTFQGLRDLNVIHNELVHGAELVYVEKIGLTDEEIKQMVSSKEQLSIFCQPSGDSPNYIPKEVAAELEKYFGKEWLQII